MSMLSRRLPQPEDPKKKPSIEPLKPLNTAPAPTAVPTAPPAPAQAAPTSAGASTDAHGHAVPPKRRTTPRIAELRKQLRGKLLASPDEADLWQRDNPEHQKMVTDRLKIYLQRANIQVSRQEFDELTV